MPRRTEWEATLRAWSKPPGDDERRRCENALGVVERAVRGCASLEGKSLEVYIKGSYANGTNVKVDSDVDVGVCYRGGLYDTYAHGLSREVVGLGVHDYRIEDLRRDVQAALVRAFGLGAEPGPIAIHMHENTYRVRADVVPCFEHRWYYRAPDGSVAFHQGEWIQPVGRNAITNWPDQNYRNGVAKNDRTGRRFKAIARSLKALRNEMEEDGEPTAALICSFLLESLVWNVPDDRFGNELYSTDLRNVLSFLWTGTEGPGGCDGWFEVNRLKYLFNPNQTWTRPAVRDFVQAAWSYLGLR